MSDLATVVADDQTPRSPAASAAGARRPKRPSFATGRCEILDAALRRLSTVQSAPQHGHWVIRTPGLLRIANVELSAGWLSISLPLRRLSRPISLEIIASLLSRNGRIDGGARIVGQRRQGGREIVADIPVEMLPWDDEAELLRLLGATVTGLDAALCTDLQCRESSAQAGLSREQVEASFDEAGWPAQPGAGESLEVPLDVPGSYFVAYVERGGPSVRLSVPILPVELGAASTTCRNAVAVLLWLTASRVRLVKPRRSRRALALEISNPPGHCNAIGLAHACAALSVTLRRCAAEAALLAASEELAQRYLSTLGLFQPTVYQRRHEVSAPRVDVHPMADNSSKGVCE